MPHASATSPAIPSPPRPDYPSAAQNSTEQALDEALDETFPASDPVAVTPEPEDSRVDRASKDSFPASDPSAPAQPGS